MKVIKSKPILITIIVVVGLIIIAAASSGNSATQNTGAPVAGTNQAGANVSGNVAPVAKTEKIVIANTQYMDRGYGLKGVVGEVTNNDSATRSMTLKVTFYDGSGKIVGTGSAAVSELAAGATKTFEAYTTDDLSSYKTFKVQVDALF